jgi:hypothetical protein
MRIGFEGNVSWAAANGAATVVSEKSRHVAKAERREWGIVVSEKRNFINLSMVEPY